MLPFQKEGRLNYKVALYLKNMLISGFNYLKYFLVTKYCIIECMFGSFAMAMCLLFKILNVSKGLQKNSSVYVYINS